MSAEKTELSSVIISRTDSIGDVMLTLPICGIIRKAFPLCKIIFLGRSYTRQIIACCEYVDEFINWDELRDLNEEQQADAIRAVGADAILHVFPDKKIAYAAKKAGVPIRVGTSHRFFHLFTCNRRIDFTRKKSELHEAQLNMKLLKGIGMDTTYSLHDLDSYSGFKRIPELKPEWEALLKPGKFHLIMHPRSKGSAREWGLDNFSKLIALLPEEKFQLFVSGTKEEGANMRTFIDSNPRLTDLTGRMKLDEFIAFINSSDGLVAASTGPLHIASALGKKAIGIFAPMRPIHPGRWAPIGTHAGYLVMDKDCADCRKSENCHCIREISPEQVAAQFMFP
jgi:heptosyltransferase-3